jgi:hypothetical protein
VAGLDKGHVVDVYAVADATSSGPTPSPQRVLSGVTVAEDVSSGDNAFGGSGGKAGVALLVPEADVSGLIDAMAHGTVYVVQVPAGAGSSASAGGS